MHHYDNVTLVRRYLKSCTTQLFRRQLFHGSWRILRCGPVVNGGPVTREAFPCDDAIIINLHVFWSDM